MNGTITTTINSSSHREVTRVPYSGNQRAPKERRERISNMHRLIKDYTGAMINHYTGGTAQ